MGSKAASSKLEHKRQQQTGIHQSGITKTARYDSAYRSREAIMNHLDVVSHTTKAYYGQRKDLELLEKMQRKYKSTITVSTVSAAPDTIAAVKYQKAVRTIKDNDEWEVKAQEGIDRKGLRLDREWNEKTWMNKSNRNEKLKLLKHDGFDITQLQGPEIGSEAITQALLAHVAARKWNSPLGIPQVTVDSRTDSPDQVEKVVEALKPSPAPAFTHHARPLSVIPLKRKRSTSYDTTWADVSYSHLHNDNDASTHKKQCTNDLRRTSNMQTPTEETTHTWYRLKTSVLSDIFRPAAPWPDSRNLMSRITIAFPSQFAKVDVPDTLNLNPGGFDNIMKELRVLGGDSDEDGKFEIPSPFPFDGQCGITVIINVPRRTVIEGDLKVLIGLVKRLATPGKGLAFMAKKSFDEGGVRFEENELFELSNATQKQLRAIGERLQADVNNGHAQVHVRWIG
jgi:hypothetical protein